MDENPYQSPRPLELSYSEAMRRRRKITLAVILFGATLGGAIGVRIVRQFDLHFFVGAYFGGVIAGALSFVAYLGILRVLEAKGWIKILGAPPADYPDDTGKLLRLFTYPLHVGIVALFYWKAGVLGALAYIISHFVIRLAVFVLGRAKAARKADSETTSN